MPGELYPESLAKLIRESNEAHYRPSNGSEGELFMASWCDNCQKQPVCDIPGNAMAFGVSDPLYPPEWTYDECGQPCCTAFEVAEGT